MVQHTGRSRLADPTGIYSMVAVDQRESLRAMLAQTSDRPVTDQQLSDFKVDVARVLSPYATGMLIDLDYGLEPIVDAGVLAPTCPVIAAVDKITYDAAGITLTTAVRHELLNRSWSDQVAGLKLLLLWSPSGWIGCSSQDVRDYIDASREAGLDSVLEVVVRDADGGAPSSEDQAGLLIDAARDLAAYAPTLYKTEVPFRGEVESARVTEVSNRITEIMDCPWVILSSGVAPEKFATAVIDTRAGGARGFLAGRAIWGSAARAPHTDREKLLETGAVGALGALVNAAHSTLALP
jgi:sulfofructosephosphate aldolase